MTLRPDHSALTWSGTISVEHTPDWSRAWRLPFERIDLFPGDELRSRATMPAGVRIEFSTDSSVIFGRAEPDPGFDQVVDLVIGGDVVASYPVGDDGHFAFEGLLSGEKVVELWLPQAGEFRLVDVGLDDGATVNPVTPSPRRKLITYGSSITQCRHAASPTRTWPALVARELGLDLTCLGFGAQCHLDPMIARMIKDRPVDVVVTCLGINIYGRGTFTDRSFVPAILGFWATVRDGHPGVPILAMSPIISPEREHIPGPGGMTLSRMREYLAEAARIMQAYGDDNLHYLNGLDVLGPAHTDRLGDGLHPDAEGYELMAKAIAPVVGGLIS